MTSLLFRLESKSITANAGIERLSLPVCDLVQFGHVLLELGSNRARCTVVGGVRTTEDFCTCWDGTIFASSLNTVLMRASFSSFDPRFAGAPCRPLAEITVPHARVFRLDGPAY